MGFVCIQFLEGLAGASSLFLMAAGLSLIFGVSRVVNFAHGSLYMLGAYAALSLVPLVGFWAALPLAAGLVALFGLILERLLLRRIYESPELFQLLATFAVTLMVEGAVPLLWGPEDVLGPRAPGLTGSVHLLGRAFPVYDLFLIAVGPVVMGGLWLALKRTRFGVLIRAAAFDREMLGALGVDERLLYTAVFALGSLLAGLGGALELPRAAIHPGLSAPVVVTAFVVVVVGGLGSLPGAFLAAILIGEMSAFGVVLWPKATLVLMFAVMAVVLALRPGGLLGKPQAAAAAPPAGLVSLRPKRREIWLGLGLWFAVALLPLLGGRYVTDLASEVAIMALFAASLSLVTTEGGMTSFGQAAWFGLGAYTAAFAHPWLGLAGAVVLAPLVAGLAGFVFARPAVRHSGITFAMLTLALAETLHSLAVQDLALTGGDDGILGIWPPDWAATPGVFHLVVVLVVGTAFALLWRLAGSSFGYALRAVRDAPGRAEAVGIDNNRLRAQAFAFGAALAGLAGGLLTYLKGGVFPDVAAISTSVDALVVFLLGGMASVFGPPAGALAYVALKAGLSAYPDLWRLAAGAVILVLVLAFPRGILRQRSRP